MNVLDEFMELVQIDSDSLHERDMVDALTAKMKTIGLDVWEDMSAAQKLGGNAGNLYGVLEGTKPGSVLFSAHMDRVANGHGIRPIVQDGRVVSQGTILAADDLSGVSAILDGLRRIKASGKEHPRIEIIFSVCEEQGVAGSVHFDYSRFQSKIGYVLDSPGAVGRIIQGAPSKAKITINVTGKNAHAGASPENGVNAVVAAAKVITRVGDGRLDAESTANFSTLQASGPTNVVNAQALIIGEARSRNDDKLQAYLMNLQAVCDEVSAEMGAIFDVKIEQHYRSFFVAEDTPCISLIKKVMEEMGIPVLINTGGGGMDANRLNEHGIECVGVATGYRNNHTIHESLGISDLEQAGELVEQLILAF